MSNNVIVTTIGPDQTGTVGKIIKLVSECGLNILDSRVATFGGEFTLTMILSGELGAIARIESSMPSLAAELGLLTMIKRTSQHQAQTYPLLYEVTYWGKDSPGVLSQVASLFADRNVSIHSLSSGTDWDEEQQQELMRSQLQVAVSCDTDGVALCKDFEALCNELGLNSHMAKLSGNEDSE